MDWEVVGLALGAILYLSFWPIVAIAVVMITCKVWPRIVRATARAFYAGKEDVRGR